MSLQICTNCVLPGNFPGIKFDDAGVCNYCRLQEERAIDFEAVRRQTEEIIHGCIGSNQSYDIALAFSGGKDSTYTLKYLRETFDARIVAITIDNDFMSDTARKNCLSVTTAMGVDHIMFRPNPRAMMDLYTTSLNKDIYSKAALKRATSVCNSCIKVINNQLIVFAANYGIPIIAGGYLGGQIPSETGFMTQNLTATKKANETAIKKLAQEFQPDAVRLFTQNTGTAKSDIYVVNPMAYLNISEEDIVEAIQPVGWVRPADTGKSSTNCLLNDYAIHHHLKSQGFHPYIAEIATMVRRGTISRDQGLEKAKAQLNDSHFEAVEKRLNQFK